MLNHIFLFLYGLKLFVVDILIILNALINCPIWVCYIQLEIYCCVQSWYCATVNLVLYAHVHVWVYFCPQAENRATEAERTVSKLQKEVDRLEGRHCVWNARMLYFIMWPVGKVTDMLSEEEKNENDDWKKNPQIQNNHKICFKRIYAA